MLILKDLIMQVELKDVKEAILKFYPDQDINLEEYERVFNKLQSLDPVKTNEDWILDVKLIKSVLNDDEMFWDVSGLWLNSSDPELSWGLEYTSWKEWLAFEIQEEQLQLLNKSEFIALCLYEMTFNGFDEEKIKQDGEEYSNLIINTIENEIKSFPDVDNILK